MNHYRLVLNCGHTTLRPVKRRLRYPPRNAAPKSCEDPPPGWVYCEACMKRSGSRRQSKRSVVSGERVLVRNGEIVAASGLEIRNEQL